MFCTILLEAMWKHHKEVYADLSQAIADRNVETLEIMLDNGASVDSIDPASDDEYDEILEEKVTGYALLTTAMGILNTTPDEFAPLTRLLVERGANLYVPVNKSQTLIHWMLQYPKYETVDALLLEPCVSRIDFNEKDQRGRTVLMAAANWTECLEGYGYKHWDPKAPGIPIRILDTGRADAKLVDDEGKTALHHILENSDMEDEVILQFLDRDEVRPILFTKDNEGYSPLHNALRVLRPEAVKRLLSKGANLLDPDHYGRTALHYIADQCLKKDRERRNQCGLPIDQPHDFFDQCLSLWNSFRASGGDINAQDKDGTPPLFVYLSCRARTNDRSETKCCHLELMRSLFPNDSGVDLHAVNNEGETALHVVAQRKKGYFTSQDHDSKLFEMLMKIGLDPLKEDKKGRSALDVASACGNEEIVRLLSRSK